MDIPITWPATILQMATGLLTALEHERVSENYLFRWKYCLFERTFPSVKRSVVDRQRRRDNAHGQRGRASDRSSTRLSDMQIWTWGWTRCETVLRAISLACNGALRLLGTHPIALHQSERAIEPRPWAIAALTVLPETRHRRRFSRTVISRLALPISWCRESRFPQRSSGSTSAARSLGVVRTVHSSNLFLF